jgi:GT2 family glycosyltransferase
VESLAAPPRVGVVVLDWNGGREAIECIESVHASSYPALEVFLVDNASREPVLDEVRRRFPDVRTRANPRNLGYAGGNNVGLRAALEAGADYVLVLNNDARVRPDTIAELVATARRDPAIAAVGAKVLRADDPTRLWLAWGEVSFEQSLVRLVGADEVDGPAYAEERDVPWVSGCAILLARRALEAIGGFDEDFFAYHEEVDWCATARERGFRVVFAPRAVVTHRGQASSGGGRYVSRKQYLAARNTIRYARKHASLGERAKLTAFLAATLPLQYARRLLSGEQEGVALKMRGIVDALLDRPLPRADLELD